MKKLTGTQRIFRIIVLLFLPLISLGKFALYEFSGAAPKLRDAIGHEVNLPRSLFLDMNSNLGADALLATDSEGLGVYVHSVRYRWNSVLGFFDLSLNCDRGEIRISPFDAMKVKVVGTSTGNNSRSE